MRKTKVTQRLKQEMGLKIIRGEIIDKYGRILETYVDDNGVEDLRCTGRVCRNMNEYNQKN